MNHVRKVFKGSVTAIAVSCAVAVPTAWSQTLEQAVAQTLDSSPELRQAFHAFKASEEQVSQARSGYLPTVDLTAGYGWEQTNSPATRAAGSGDVEFDRGEAGISIRQILFNGFQTTSEVGRTRMEAGSEFWSLLSSAEDKALDVVKVYLGYLQAKEVVSLSEKNLQSHQEIYDQIKQKTEFGLGSTADLSQISGRLARAKSNLVSARNNLMDMRSQYIRTVNSQPEDMIIPVPDADMLPATLEDALELARKNNPVVKAAGKDIEAAQYQRDTAESSYYPEVSLELNGNWNNDIGGTGGHNNDLQAMVRVRYNLYNGGRDSARERETAYRLGEARELNMRTMRDITEGTTLAWNARTNLQEQLGYIKDHVIASKETQSAYNLQFRLGQRTLLDLLDAENELFEARKDYIASEFDELTAQYRILNATGQLLSSLRVETPEAWQGDNEY